MFKRILLLISLPIIAYSQNQFKLYFDAARFCIDDSTGYIEIYYSFPYSEMNKKVVNSDTLINGSLSIKIVTEKDYEQGLNTKTYVVPYTEYDTFYNSLEYNSDVKNGINALAGINTCTIVSDFKQTDVKINIDRINKILNNSKEYNFKDNMLIIN